MAVITNPEIRATTFSGQTRLVSFYNLTTTTATDNIILSAASNGISAIQNVIATTNRGLVAGFTQVGVTYSGLTVTFDNVELL